jgi:hypothetical protein
MSHAVTHPPIVIEPIERRRPITVSSSKALTTTSIIARSTAVTSGPHVSMTSSKTRWSSAVERFTQRQRQYQSQQQTNVPAFTHGEDDTMSQSRQRPGESHRLTGQQRFVYVGTIATNGVTRTLFIERSELPPPGGVKWNSQMASTLSTTTATSVTSSASEVACRKQQVGTSATAASVLDRSAAVTGCTESTAASGLLSFNFIKFNIKINTLSNRTLI